MSTMCALCEAWYKRYPLIDGHHILDTHSSMAAVQCAFPDGVFISDNWSCQTMLKLRELSGEGDWIPGDRQDDYFHTWYQWDDNAGSIGILAIPEKVAFESEEMQMGYLVMTWYKSRGTTGNALVMCDDEAPEKLTLKTAEAIIVHLQQKRTRGVEPWVESTLAGQAVSLTQQYIQRFPTWIPKQESEQADGHNH